MRKSNRELAALIDSESEARYTLVVQRGLLERFRLVAKRNDRTLSAELRQLMREAIDREQERDAA